ncbi:zf-HC2 domain-containing protein [Kribbella sp. VKM Ac-2568]|uniref:anti-sigma factor n=1 Tax=Kribbella sp. VKM Ac-2568 TaxID=2512219 RepID=UPI001043FEEC|nr:zf-HC2 domain-containing protein [Kribbella sp. VKM Ac-2568]TCM37203.1 putative zinc finger protein [Kribbella sp. VKM Ac-2568]
MTCPDTVAIGAYVLGALDPAERLELERHLPDCPTCLDALLRFANLPGLLNTLTLEEAISTAADHDLAESLALGQEHNLLTAASLDDARSPALAQVPASADAPVIGRSAGRPRRTIPRRRALVATAAAICLGLTGVVIGRQTVTQPAPQAQTSVNWSATDGVGGLDTTARLSNQSWGTGIQLQMKDLNPGELCKLVVHARSGALETTGWWTTNYLDQAEVPASTSIALPDIDRIDVVTAAGRVLTSLSPSTR